MRVTGVARADNAISAMEQALKDLKQWSAKAHRFAREHDMTWQEKDILRVSCVRKNGEWCCEMYFDMELI